MTIPESVREALFNLKSIEDVEVTRDAVLVHKWRETVCEWAVENLLNSDDDEPVTVEWLQEIGWENMLLITDPNLWCHRDTHKVAIRFLYGKPRLWFKSTANEWHEVSKAATRGQVRNLISALKGE